MHNDALCLSFIWDPKWSNMQDRWQERAACFRHSFLHPDSWGEVDKGYPTGLGAQAALVCRFVCPVREQCNAQVSGVNIIAGRGWWNQRGTFVRQQDSEIELNQAAAYLGVPVSRVQQLIAQKRIKEVRRLRFSTFLNLHDVMSAGVALSLGPWHGTIEAKRLHQLKGQPLCESCVMVDDLVSV